jgi:hypothetical protein
VGRGIDIERFERSLTFDGPEAEFAVVDEEEKADMGKCLGRKRDTAGEATEVGRLDWSSSSSGSASRVGGFVSMRALRSRQTAWKPPCSQLRSPSKPSFLNFRRRP